MHLAVCPAAGVPLAAGKGTDAMSMSFATAEFSFVNGPVRCEGVTTANIRVARGGVKFDEISGLRYP